MKVRRKNCTKLKEDRWWAMLGYNIIFVTFNNYMNIIKNISIRNHYLTIMGPYDKGTVLAFPNARTVPLFQKMKWCLGGCCGGF